MTVAASRVAADVRRGGDPIAGGHRALLIQFASDFSGFAVSGRLVAEAMVEDGWRVHVAFAHAGPYMECYERVGCETSVVPRKSWLRAACWPRSVRRVLPKGIAGGGA